MRVIVSLLKFFVGAAFFLCTIGLAFIVGGSLFGFTFGEAGAQFGVLMVVGGLAAFVVLVLYIGMVALLISGHDRLCDIARILDERNDLLRNRSLSD